MPKPTSFEFHVTVVPPLPDQEIEDILTAMAALFPTEIVVAAGFHPNID